MSDKNILKFPNKKKHEGDFNDEELFFEEIEPIVQLLIEKLRKAELPHALVIQYKGRSEEDGIEGGFAQCGNNYGLKGRGYINHILLSMEK
jgi:hypothetical protein